MNSTYQKYGAKFMLFYLKKYGSNFVINMKLYNELGNALLIKHNPEIFIPENERV